MTLYVTMTDTFLSGWGKAEGKICKFVYECDNWEQAEIVEQNAKSRTDTKYVNICINKPHYNSKRYLVQEKDKTNSSIWYKPNAFK